MTDLVQSLTGSGMTAITWVAVRAKATREMENFMMWTGGRGRLGVKDC